MEIYRVSFIGHRKLYDLIRIEEKLEQLIHDLISTKEYVEFYLGRNGDFDISSASVIKRVQNKLGKHNNSLILVLPYHTKNEEYYETYYDEILIPVDQKTHFKAAITLRNEWIIDNSDLLIAFVQTSSGGAYNALVYAKKKNIQIVNIASDNT